MKNFLRKSVFVFLSIYLVFSLKSYAEDLDKGIQALINKNYEEALYYLSFYAVQGDDRAQYNLGVMYREGAGVEIDKKEALGWFILSAEQNNMLAQYSLGIAYFKGDGVKVNYETALRQFKRAAYQGHPSSQVNVGNMYFKGQGVKKDFIKAHMWWSIAKEKGLQGAFENLLMIENLMNESEIKKSNDLFNACMKKTLPEC